MVATSVADQSGNTVRWRAAIGIAAAIGVTLCAAGSSSATADVRIVPSCKRDNIQLTLGRGGVATGHAFIRIILRNVGKAPCALRGYPSLRAWDHGRVVPTRTVRGGSGPLAAPVRRITIRSKTSAVLVVSYDTVPVGTQPCPTADTMGIALSGWTPRKRIRLQVSLCTPLLRTSPVVAAK